MPLLGSKVIRLQDAKFKLAENSNNEASIYIPEDISRGLGLVAETEITFFINKIDVIKLLGFTFSFQKGLFNKRDKVSLDLDWFEKQLKLINNHYQNSSEFIFGIQNSRNRFYLNSLRQNSGLNLRELFIENHVKLDFHDEAKVKTIKIETNIEGYKEEDPRSIKIFEEGRTNYGSKIREENIDTFNYKQYVDEVRAAGLLFSDTTILRFVSSLLTKQFVILTGLSGSGKTKLAQSFATWICEDTDQHCIVPVGADWTNREALLGYPNALVSNEYKLDDFGVLKLILNANSNKDKPYFLILDEMNLSHVERYFADFLSAMESSRPVSLHSGSDDWNGVPNELFIPPNLFIIGTVNIDETTYMFSPKVLDRANVIEFKISESEITEYLKSESVINLQSISAAGASQATSFININRENINEVFNKKSIADSLLKFFLELKKIGAEFGYRNASEILRYAAIVKKLNPRSTSEEILDAAIMQKLLPKVHGSQRKLEPVLRTLGALCVTDKDIIEDLLRGSINSISENSDKVIYPISLDKIVRMYHNLMNNSFTSYAEA